MSDLDEYVRPLEELGGLGLRRPYALIAFGGWIDASWAATNALRYLVDQLAAPRVAELDPELFYNFTDTRPRVVMRGAGDRTVRWRQGRWHAARLDDEVEHDLVLFIAPEPNLRWRTFTRVLLDVFQQVGVEALLTIGAVLAPTHHRARVPLRGWATTEAWRLALRGRGIRRNAYEGPTGIATILSVGARERGIAALSVTASTPNYLGNSANPRTSLELLRAIGDVYGMRLPLADLERGVRSYNEQVDQLLANQPELRAEIDKLAESVQEEPEPPAQQPPSAEGTGGADLPGGADVVRELEDFLKQLRKPQDDSPEET
ncbi:MAG: PAC2 family protein [Chloroflexi bacterium]|nr:PAC2 family protein [Chloroflexota bacterium]MBV9597896.1 PAC2 family protein [Chloroflexota bacterium]